MPAPTGGLPWLLPHRPFITPAPKRWTKAPPEPSLDLTDFDMAQNVMFETVLTEWALRHGYLVPYGKDRFQTTLPDNQGQVANRLIHTNFRHLPTSVEVLAGFITALEDSGDDITMNQLLDLTVELNTRVDTRFLTLYLNRVYRSLDAVRDPRSQIGWDAIHIRYPFMWVLYAVQQLQLRWRPPSDQ